MVRFAVKVGEITTASEVPLGTETVTESTTPNMGNKSIVTVSPVTGYGTSVIRVVPTGTTTGGSGGIVLTNESRTIVTRAVVGVPKDINLLSHCIILIDFYYVTIHT
jgi:hypothetical protein